MSAERQSPVPEEVHSVEMREEARRSLADDLEAYLSDGGKVVEVQANLRADPPRKPQNNYGRGSI